MLYGPRLKRGMAPLALHSAVWRGNAKYPAVALNIPYRSLRCSRESRPVALTWQDKLSEGKEEERLQTRAVVHLEL